MADVARLAGVSTMTVSRALKQHGQVSGPTREKIIKAVNELGYVLDHSAGTLSSRRTGFIAALVPSINNSNFSDTARGITEELERAGLQLMLGYTDYSEQKEEELIETMLLPIGWRGSSSPAGSIPSAPGTCSRGRPFPSWKPGTCRSIRSTRLGGLFERRGHGAVRRARWPDAATSGSALSAEPRRETSAATSVAGAFSAPSMSSACRLGGWASVRRSADIH